MSVPINQSIDINRRNIGLIQQQAQDKQCSSPYNVVPSVVSLPLTDFDSFPYTRWFRGDYTSPDPMVIEREAGYRALNNNCYKPKVNNIPTADIYPNHVFQSGTSTVLPSYPEYMSKLTDKDFLSSVLNRACIITYR